MNEYPDLEVTGQIDPMRSTTNSSLEKLCHKVRKFMLAYAYDYLTNDIIRLRHIIIGDRVYNSNKYALPGVPFSNERFPQQIDEIPRIEEISYEDVDVTKMKNYSEDEIKQWFADIMKESFVQSHWAGQKCDLYTSHLHVEGERKTAAFLLKGPSHFNVMKNRDLGKNGDQIVRLFSESADLYILQHCYVISADVRSMMKTFASRFYQPSLFTIIDGNDTMRILKAYEKI